MTLLICLIGAILSTIVWYLSAHARRLYIGKLVLMFWGASLMWMVDLFYEYLEVKSKVFTPSATVMINDAFLGVSVVVLALVIWLVLILVKDPLHVIHPISNQGR